MKVYYSATYMDTFNRKSLISIAFISSNHKSFYAEFSDYNKRYKHDKYIPFKSSKENNLLHNRNMFGKDLSPISTPSDEYYIYGTQSEIKVKLEKFFSEFESVEIISDSKQQYIIGLLIDIFGSAFNFPENVIPTWHDINMDIAKFCEVSEDKSSHYG